MMACYRRPDRRPGCRRTSRGAIALGFLGLGIVLTFLGSCLNLAILDATTELAAAEEQHDMLESEVRALRFDIQRLTGIAELEPRFAEAGFVPAPPGAVLILAASSVSTGARPLPGAGALGRLMRQIMSLARVEEAQAAAADREVAGEGGSAHSAADMPVLHERCEHCHQLRLTLDNGSSAVAP